LMADKYFRQKIQARWKELRADKWTNTQLFGKIDSMQTLLTESQARNFQKWPILGEYVWPNAFVGNSWNEEIGYMRTWLTDRLAWMDVQIDGFLLDTVAPEKQIIDARPIPNPAKGSTFFKYRVESSASVTLRLLDSNGRLVEQFERLPTGPNAVFELPLHVESGVYFWQIWNSDQPISEGKIIVTP
jgi:CotH kinase protein